MPGPTPSKPPLRLLLAAPRGSCAGVERAVRIVELALARFGAPVYVRHEIVHNRFVVEGLRARGAVFVEELDEVPDGAPVVFSAHGVPKSVRAEAARRAMRAVDATCPLVAKVHREVERHHADGRRVVLIGHAGHAEVEGTVGQLPPGAVRLVENVADAEALEEGGGRWAYATQTTLSVDDADRIVAALRRRLPDLAGPAREDICYATTNRQRAVKAVAARADALLVVGAPNSSNSLRLVEVARAHGCPEARLVERAADLDWPWIAGARALGLTAGASAPEVLVREVVEALGERFDLAVEEVAVAREDVTFRLPPELAEAAAGQGTG